MSWNPFRKKQDDPAPGEQPVPPVDTPAPPVDDDRTDQLVANGGIEEQVQKLEGLDGPVTLERVVLTAGGKAAGRFLRARIIAEGSLADDLNKVLFALDNRLTGFVDLLVDPESALSAKLDCPDATLATLLPGAEPGHRAVRALDIIYCLRDTAWFLADVRQCCGLGWARPRLAGIGVHASPGALPSHEGFRYQFLDWGGLTAGDEHTFIKPLVEAFTAALDILRKEADNNGLGWHAARLNLLIDRLDELGEKAETYSNLAAALAGVTPGFELTGATDTGKKRQHNEDAYMLLDLDQQSAFGARFILTAVADGMGGHQSGEVASSLTLDLLRQQLLTTMLAPHSTPLDPGRLAEQAAQIIPGIDRLISERAGMEAHLANMGTTLCGLALIIPESTLPATGSPPGPTAASVLFNVGDTRAYLIAPGGLARLTKDHSYVQDLVDAGSITLDEAFSHKMKNVITRCIGGGTSEATPDVYHFTPGPGEVIMLASDGVGDALRDADIWEVVKANGKRGLRELAQAVIDAANAAGGPDNITVVLVGSS